MQLMDTMKPKSHFINHSTRVSVLTKKVPRDVVEVKNESWHSNSGGDPPPLRQCRRFCNVIMDPPRRCAKSPDKNRFLYIYIHNAILWCWCAFFLVLIISDSKTGYFRQFLCFMWFPSEALSFLLTQNSEYGSKWTPKMWCISSVRAGWWRWL